KLAQSNNPHVRFTAIGIAATIGYPAKKCPAITADSRALPLHDYLSYLRALYLRDRLIPAP
ncbi:MAG: hypothetical protein ACRCWC_17535, partial [Plesiomonas shigelloides]